MDVTIWSIQGSFDKHIGAALGTGRAVKTAQDPGENRRLDKKVWLPKGRKLRRTGRHLDLSSSPQNTAGSLGEMR